MYIMRSIGYAGSERQLASWWLLTLLQGGHWLTQVAIAQVKCLHAHCCSLPTAVDGEMEAKRKQSSDLEGGVSSDADVDAVDSEFVVPSAAVRALPGSTPAAQPGQQGEWQLEKELAEAAVAAAAAAELEEKATLELEEQLDAVHAQVLNSQVGGGQGNGRWPKGGLSVTQFRVWVCVAGLGIATWKMGTQRD